MILSFDEKLSQLALLVSLGDTEIVNGWPCSCLTISDEVLETLAGTYQALIIPAIDTEIRDRLLSEGVDFNGIFVEEESRDVVTRSDMIELLAAASVISTHQIPISNIHLPNVPKGSRKQSSPGIDVMGFLLDEEESNEPLLIICSVKHTISDARDLRSKLVSSVSSETLTVPYLAGQLRVFKWRLDERGVECKGLMLVLSNFPDPLRSQILAVAGIPNSLESEFREQLGRLPTLAASTHSLRVFSIPNLSTLHERVADG